MKKMILVLTALVLAGASVQTVSAGGSGWCTAGKVLAGVTAGVVIGEALTPRPVYYATPPAVYYPAPGYGYAYSYAPAAQPAVVYAAPPPVVYVAPAPAVVYRPRVYIGAPVVSVRAGYYGGCRPYGYRYGRW